MVYKPLAVRVALIAGFRRALPVFTYMIVVVEAVVMWETPPLYPYCLPAYTAPFSLSTTKIQ
jgi:hypothetical protein